jgi:hypothetical protein
MYDYSELLKEIDDQLEKKRKKFDWMDSDDEIGWVNLKV